MSGTREENIRSAKLREEVVTSMWVLLVKTADEIKRSNVTLSADAAIKFLMFAGRSYQFRAKIFFDSNSAADFKWRHSGPSSPSLVRVMRRNYACGDTAISDEAVDVAYSSADIVLDGAGSTGGYIEICGIIANGSTEGSFEFQWAQNSSHASDSTVLKGSFIEYREII
jgi:hypothetical protein